MNRKIPDFRSGEEEKAYWKEVDEGQNAGRKVRRSNTSGGLKLPERTASLCLPGAMLEELRVQSHLMMDVPQQCLMKTYLLERIEREMWKERWG